LTGGGEEKEEAYEALLCGVGAEVGGVGDDLALLSDEEPVGVVEPLSLGVEMVREGESAL